MLAGNAYDGLGPDHLRFKPNPCGVVMSMDLDSSYSATQAQVKFRVSNVEPYHITLHYITYSTQQGVGTPLGANERLIGGGTLEENITHIMPA
jgi:hypothetical protein